MPKNPASAKWYALFGHKKDDIDVVGWFGKNGQIVDDISAAKKFPSRNVLKVKGFGSPKKWCEMINNDSDLNSNFKFHLVGTTLSC